VGAQPVDPIGQRGAAEPLLAQQLEPGEHRVAAR